MANKLWARLDALPIAPATAAVLELVSLDELLVPGKDIFTKELAFVDVTTIASIAVGWVFDGSTFVAPVAPAPAPPTVAQLLARASNVQNQILTKTWSFEVGTDKAPLKLTTALDAAGQAAILKLAVWAIMNQSNANASEAYSNFDFTAATISPAQAAMLAAAAGAVVSASYSTLNAVSAAIMASPATITTFAQIDSAAWPTS